jgi:uncharacterized phage infection (PIP) family protein YhgE
LFDISNSNNFRLNLYQFNTFIMKKAVLISPVAIVALLAVYSFSTIDKYPDSVTKSTVAMFNSHYLKTINNTDLNIPWKVMKFL